MQLVSEDGAAVARLIQQGTPESGQLGEGLVDDAIGTLGPGIDHLPREAT